MSASSAGPSDDHASSAGDGRTSIAVVVCTYRRNDPLRTLLNALIVAARDVHAAAAVGVVIVDDNPDGAAQEVADAFVNEFELGVHYRRSGKQNVSIARNLGLNTAATVAEWIVMTDDDCEPPPHWLSAHITAQRETGCDATTGAMKLRAPAGAPRWLLEQPFYGDYEIRHEHLQPLEATGTNNMMIRGAWVRAHPDIRFLEQFGRCGGEDWIFFRMARKTGLTLRFSNDAWVIGNEPPERLTWRYQMLNRLWLGNSEYFVNSFTREAPQWVLIKRAWDRLPRALFNVIRNYSEPHYSLAVVARHTGYLLAIFGVRLRHH